MATVDLNHPDAASVPVRDAATVVLLRQATDGIEVCMLQRNLKSDFVGGAYVFPGGGVDPEDSDPTYRQLVLEEASGAGGSEDPDLAFRIAAARESFEEAGILFAKDRDGQSLALSDPVVQSRFRQHRLDVDSGRRPLSEICREEGLRLDLGDMVYFSRWITPLGAPRRYDTRFFVAETPADQDALHDDVEVIDTVWISPQDALADMSSGRRTMIFPTVRTIVTLSRFAEVGQVLEYAASLGPVAPIEPVMSQVGDRLYLELPGDPEGNGGKYDALSGEPLSAS